METFMNKAELIEELANSAESSKADAGRFLDAFVNIVQNSVKKSEDIAIAGFGTFTKSKRAARNARNPQTGETIKIKAKSVPKFKAGKAFKELVK